MAGEIEIRHHETCSECGAHMELEVLRSPAGYYLGTECERDGPYGRESGYFPTYELANQALNQWLLGNRVGARDADYHPAPMIVAQFETSEDFEDFTRRYYAGQDDEP